MSILRKSSVYFACSTLLLFHLAISSWAETNVHFDVPAVVVAEVIDPAFVTQPSSGGKFIRLRFPVSAFVAPELQGEVSEYVIEVGSPQASLRVVDFWPRNEMTSEIDGTIKVDESRNQTVEASLSASAGFEPFARGSANGKYQSKSDLQEHYTRKPQMEALTSSGTTQRGYGCFFKFRPGPASQLEGAREIAILAEVPQTWRADTALVRMRAVGRGSDFSRPKPLSHSTMWMTIHLAGDQTAAAQAQRFLRGEQALRSMAHSAEPVVAKRAYPSMWHRVGAALDVVEPRIPEDYLFQVLYGPSEQYLEGNAHRLPIELRVAILDYWEERKQLQSLAFGG